MHGRMVPPRMRHPSVWGQGPLSVASYDRQGIPQAYSDPGTAGGNLAYEIPAPIEKWTHQILWPGEQQPAGVTQPQYNIVLNKQNMVFVDPSMNKVQNPIVLTTLSIDPTMLTPSSDQSQTSADISLNPCILLKQNPEALLATIPENLQVVGQTDRNKFYNTLPSKMRQQNAETQTPLPVRHKESAV